MFYIAGHEVRIVRRTQKVDRSQRRGRHPDTRLVSR